MKKPALDLSDIWPPNVSSIFEPSFSLSDTVNNLLDRAEQSAPSFYAARRRRGV
jgi:hypothetical protein